MSLGLGREAARGGAGRAQDPAARGMNTLGYGATIKVRSRIASPGNVPETPSVASPSVFPLPHDPPAELQLPFLISKSMLTDGWPCGVVGDAQRRPSAAANPQGSSCRGHDR